MEPDLPASSAPVTPSTTPVPRSDATKTVVTTVKTNPDTSGNTSS